MILLPLDFKADIKFLAGDLLLDRYIDGENL